jgi:soluble P-type ATPase
MHLSIPDYGDLHLVHLVCDFNGTLAVGGDLLPGVAQELNKLSGALRVHVVTADTFGKARAALAGVMCTVTILPAGEQSAAKQAYIEALGAERTVAIGNGRNDRLMLQTAALGIAVLLEEGAAVDTIQNADILVPGILPALSLLSDPRRLMATLRG